MAADSMVKEAEDFGLPGPVDEWAALRDAIQCRATQRGVGPNGAGTVGNTPQAFSHFALINPELLLQTFR